MRTRYYHPLRLWAVLGCLTAVSSVWAAGLTRTTRTEGPAPTEATEPAPGPTTIARAVVSGPTATSAGLALPQEARPGVVTSGSSAVSATATGPEMPAVTIRPLSSTASGTAAGLPGVVVLSGAEPPVVVAPGLTRAPTTVTSETPTARITPAPASAPASDQIGVRPVKVISAVPLTLAQAPAETTPAAPKQPEPAPAAATTGVTAVTAPATTTPAPAPSGQSVIRPAGTAAPTPEAATPGVTGTTTAVTAKPGQALTLTPEAAAALAVKNSLELGIDATDIRQAEAQVRKAFGLDDFQLTASATFGRKGPISTVDLGEGKSMSLGSADIATEQLQLVKPLYSGKQIERAQDLAMRSLELTRLSADVTARALDLTAREVAYGVLRASQLADVAQQRAVAVAAHLDLSKKLADAGVVAQFEVVQANTQLATAQGEVISARTNIENAKARLKRVLTLPQDTELEVTQGAAFEAPLGDVQTLVQQALEQRPEVAASESGVKVAEANLQLAKSTSALSVNLAAGLTHTKASFGSEPTSWQVAVAAQKPILDGREREAAIQQAKAQVDAAKLQLEKTKQEIGLAVTQAYLNLGDAQERLRVAKEGVVNAEEQTRIAKVRYEGGIALGVEVIDAETNLAAARAEVVNAEYNVEFAIAQLRSSVGLWGANEGGPSK